MVIPNAENKKKYDQKKVEFCKRAKKQMVINHSKKGKRKNIFFAGRDTRKPAAIFKITDQLKNGRNQSNSLKVLGKMVSKIIWNIHMFNF